MHVYSVFDTPSQHDPVPNAMELGRGIQLPNGGSAGTGNAMGPGNGAGWWGYGTQSNGTGSSASATAMVPLALGGMAGAGNSVRSVGFVEAAAGGSRPSDSDLTDSSASEESASMSEVGIYDDVGIYDSHDIGRTSDSLSRCLRASAIASPSVSRGRKHFTILSPHSSSAEPVVVASRAEKKHFTVMGLLPDPIVFVHE